MNSTGPGEHDESSEHTAAVPPGRVSSGPFVTRCEAAKYAWCRCQKSTTYPYCDGTHRGSDVSPMKVTFLEPKVVKWCACGRSGAAPFCDGSHVNQSV